jgi:hypothetical protein
MKTLAFMLLMIRLNGLGCEMIAIGRCVVVQRALNKPCALQG